MPDPIRLALIDDDAAVRDALQLYFTRKRVSTTCFSAAEDFLEAANGREPFDCIVADVRMPGISGLDLVKYLNDRGSLRPIILITGHGDIDMAVSAVKAGAFDFIEKPFDESRLLAGIRDAVEKSRERVSEAAHLEQMQARYASLSARQRQVMEFAAAGLSNKEIGAKLNISPKTVENHRAWVMERIGARNIAELVRISMQISMKV
jgi:two-component system, LuxR family, response regulator FixJ